MEALALVVVHDHVSTYISTRSLPRQAGMKGGSHQCDRHGKSFHHDGAMPLEPNLAHLPKVEHELARAGKQQPS